MADNSLYSDYAIIYDPRSSLVTDFPAVFQGVWNLLNTTKGERLFNPLFGANFRHYLGEKCNEMTALTIKNDIANVLKAEPRVKFLYNKSKVIPIPTKKMYQMHLYFSILGFSGTEKSLNLFLTKEGELV